MSIRNVISLLPLGAVMALGGCYEEPVSAQKTVPAEHRVYLKNLKLESLSADVVFGHGKVFQNGWTNLSSLVESFDPASLDYLNLDYNSLTNITAVREFKSLKWLRINNNSLSALPDMSPLVSLRRIYLRGNRFLEVPDALCSLPALTDIDLSENPISEVPDWLAAKEGLEHISLSRTRIKKLPDDLSKWTSLRTLQLGELSGMPKDEMDRIRAALPKTAVVF